MPTNRTRRQRGRGAEVITPEAVAAWRAGDYWALHRALNLRPWQMPDWRCDPPGEDDRPGALRSAYPVPDVGVIKVMLLEAAGPASRTWVFKHAY